jgi:hypothetical protein
MDKPQIQIGDEVREMTDEEYAEYQKLIQEMPKLEGIPE